MKLTAALLWPASMLYNAAARIRWWAYRAGIAKQRRLRGVVVGVGNITTGGTGKTPVVLWIAERALGAGKKVGLLSRGYRPLPPGSDAGAHGWNDEVALLHGRLGARVEFGVGANRFEKGKELQTRGVEWFILDDGFQHLQLARDVDIVMIDATKPFGGGHILPSGRLREPVSALQRADILVIHRAEERVPAIEAVIRRYSQAPIYFSQAKLLGLEEYRGGDAATPPAAGTRFFAFCGIGNPPAFFADLKKWAIALAGSDTFSDHHRYTNADMARLEQAARAAGADALVCTEKDTYDLPPNTGIGIPIYFCKIGLKFDDEEGLWREILGVIEKRNRGRTG
ncbi:MAG TPA: tetraacyldisaccharide 4'-kinase [Candidatus Acidoferrales bacterium]|nr:tetraacyldisaccharide 4'-kinase [Candidatus Acidoferrales bacterium]